MFYGCLINNLNSAYGAKGNERGACNGDDKQTVSGVYKTCFRLVGESFAGITGKSKSYRVKGHLPVNVGRRLMVK